MILQRMLGQGAMLSVPFLLHELDLAILKAVRDK